MKRLYHLQANEASAEDPVVVREPLRVSDLARLRVMIMRIDTRTNDMKVATISTFLPLF